MIARNISTADNVYDPLGRLSSSVDWSGTTNYGYFQDGTPQFVQNPWAEPADGRRDRPAHQTAQGREPARRDHDFFGYNALGEHQTELGIHFRSLARGIRLGVR